MDELIARCDESDAGDAVQPAQPASRAQAAVGRPGLRSAEAAAEPNDVYKLSGIRISQRRMDNDEIVALLAAGFMHRRVEKLLDEPSGSLTASDSGGDPPWFTTAVLVRKI